MLFTVLHKRVSRVYFGNRIYLSSIFTRKCHNHNDTNHLPQSAKSAPKEYNLFESKSLRKRIKMITCGRVYKQFRLIRLFRKSPYEGIELDVDYIDTAPNDRSLPVILALHGVPGSYYDYTKLIQYFIERDNCARVIVPNFPTFTLTKRTLCYWHSADEKAQYIRDFLRRLNIDKVDTLVCHSGGVFPGALLWAETPDIKFSVKSVALLNTPNISWPSFVQVTGAYLFVMFLQSNMGKRWMFKDRNVQYWIRLLGFPSAKTSDEIFEAACSFTYSRINDLNYHFNFLKQRSIPTFILISENDKIISYSALVETANACGALREDTTVIDTMERYDDDLDNLEMITDDNSDGVNHVLNIRPAGHYGFIKYADIVNPYIEKLLLKSKSVNLVESNLRKRI